MTTGDLHNGTSAVTVILTLLMILVVGVGIVLGWQNHRSYIYSIGREIAKYGTLVQTYHLSYLKGDHFVVKYYPGDKEQATLALEAAENFVGPIAEKLGYIPEQEVTIVVYPTREKLNNYFGWPADESAMGVYWAGTIRVLAPREWINTDNAADMREIFFSSGPMAHEIAHLAVDYRTRGNYTRWFTEGIAQYIELELTGFRFKDPAGTLDQQRYSIEQLTNQFDQLPNQSLAYRQSLAATYYLVAVYGEGVLTEILDELMSGATMDQALQRTCDVDLKNFENQLNKWLDNNWHVLS
ncbi:hypothetical protein V6C27_12680 [Peptococcaceae bacterium 1198_IL3148]